MTFTYTNSPATVRRDRIRRMIGDTVSTDPLLTDEELADFMALHPDDDILCAAEACEAIAAGFARDAVSYVGDLTNSPALKADNYLKIARALRKRIEAEGSEQKPVRPGYSSIAINRGAVIKRGSCYGSE